MIAIGFSSIYERPDEDPYTQRKNPVGYIFLSSVKFGQSIQVENDSSARFKESTSYYYGIARP